MNRVELRRLQGELAVWWERVRQVDDADLRIVLGSLLQAAQYVVRAKLEAVE